jgi:hypothetical protein
LGEEEEAQADTKKHVYTNYVKSVLTLVMELMMSCLIIMTRGKDDKVHVLSFGLLLVPRMMGRIKWDMKNTQK